MTAMELLVRPFGFVVVTPPPRAPSVAVVVIPPVEFALGGKGGRTISITLDKFNVVIEKDKNDLKESGRKSTKVRVENEDDPDQFVEFCRADKITMSPVKKGTSSPAAASHASTDTSTAPQKGPKKDTPQDFSYVYPPDKTCKSPSEPPKGCK